MAERDKKMHEALDREAFEFVVEKRGDFRLVDAKFSGNLRLGEPLAFDNPVDSGAESSFGLEFNCIGQPQIGEDVAAARGNPICFDSIHISLRNRVEQFSSAH